MFNTIMGVQILLPRIARVRKIKFKLDFQFLLPNPGPKDLPSDSGRGDVELACVCVSVASLAVDFAPESMFWNLAEKKVVSNTGNKSSNTLE